MYIPLMVDYINLFISLAIFTHGVEKLLYELNCSNNNKFCNVFLNINEVSVVVVISKTFKFEKRVQY